MTQSCRVVLVNCDRAQLGVGAALEPAPLPTAALNEWGVAPRAGSLELAADPRQLRFALRTFMQLAAWRTRLCLHEGQHLLAIVEPRTDSRPSEAAQAQIGAALRATILSPSPARPAPGEAAQAPGMFTVFLVEDDPVVRWVCRRILQDHYFVAEAGNGLDALSLKDWLPWPVDLLVSDVNLPQMDGVTLARLWLEGDPAARVLLLSGSFFPEIAGTLPVLFLQKPFQAQELLRCTEVLLGARGAQRG
jgi:CheY-like chemotaxis protein